MSFPKLNKQSKNLQKIPYPKDFGLENIIDHMFDNSLYLNEDVGKERILDYAKNLINYPETNKDIIKGKQEILQGFMKNPKLINLILNKKINPNSENHLNSSKFEDFDQKRRIKFNNSVERVKNYFEFITQLSVELPETENKELNKFKGYINNMVTKGKRFGKIRTILQDIQKPMKINFETFFFENPWQPYSNPYEIDRIDVRAEFESGEEIKMKDRASLKAYFLKKVESILKVPYNSFLKKAFIKSQTKKIKTSLKSPAEFNLFFDEKSNVLEGSLTSYKIDILKTLLSFKKKTKCVKSQIKFNNEDFSIEDFLEAKNYLKSLKFNYMLKMYEKDIEEFTDSLVELKYFAIAADYFNKLKKEGVSLTFPKFVKGEEQKTAITNLIEPNLLRKKELEDIISNDVTSESSKNLFLITGTNNNGKTTYLNSLGIAQAMGQAGLMVFAKDAILSPKENILTHYLRAEKIVTGESRYAEELLEIKNIIKNTTTNSLILIDELCSGTVPKDGQKEADAIIRTLGELGATTYITTHFHNLIDTVKELSYGQNLYCVSNMNEEGLIYTYKIEKGFSKQSDGLYLAKNLEVDRKSLRSLIEKRAKNEGFKLR